MVQECFLDVRKDMLSNVIVSGCTTLFKGFPERLRAELQTLNGTKSTVTVEAPEDRDISVWLGGSVLASLHGFKKRYMYREAGVLPFGMPDDTLTYADAGKRIVTQYCYH